MPPGPIAFAESQVVSDPCHIALLGAIRIMPQTQHLANLVEEFHGHLLGGIGAPVRFARDRPRGLFPMCTSAQSLESTEKRISLAPPNGRGNIQRELSKQWFGGNRSRVG